MADLSQLLTNERGEFPKKFETIRRDLRSREEVLAYEYREVKKPEGPYPPRSPGFFKDTSSAQSTLSTASSTTTKKYQRSDANLGTIGHVDHGKTTLTPAHINAKM